MRNNHEFLVSCLFLGDSALVAFVLRIHGKTSHFDPWKLQEAVNHMLFREVEVRHARG